MPRGQYIHKLRGKHKEGCNCGNCGKHPEDCTCGSCKKHPEDCEHCLVVKGRIVSDEVGYKISIAKKGKPSNRKGQSQTLHTREAIRNARIVYFQEHPGILSGENNPMWLGGIEQQPYPIEFNEELREKIRKRDNYQC